LDVTSSSKERKDTWVWGGEDDDFYTIKDIYNKVQDKGNEEKDILFTKLWAIKALSIAQYFVWKTTLNRLTTKDSLKHGGFRLDITTNHLFFECKIGATVWSM